MNCSKAIKYLIGTQYFLIKLKVDQLLLVSTLLFSSNYIIDIGKLSQNPSVFNFQLSQNPSVLNILDIWKLLINSWYKKVLWNFHYVTDNFLISKFSINKKHYMIQKPSALALAQVIIMFIIITWRALIRSQKFW